MVWYRLSGIFCSCRASPGFPVIPLAISHARSFLRWLSFQARPNQGRLLWPCQSVTTIVFRVSCGCADMSWPLASHLSHFQALVTQFHGNLRIQGTLHTDVMPTMRRFLKYACTRKSPSFRPLSVCGSKHPQRYFCPFPVLTHFTYRRSGSL